MFEKRGSATGIFLLIALCALLAAMPAYAARPSFEAVHGSELQPSFRWKARDYAARCSDDGLQLRIDGASGWRTKVPGRPSRAGTFAETFASGPGVDIPITFRSRRNGTVERFHVRCLPADFPEYRFKRISPGGAKLFMVHLPDQYAAIFDDDGVPVWWAQADGVPLDAKILPDGTISWASVSAVTGTSTGAFDIRALNGKVIRSVGSDATTDVHDLQVLPNGNYV